MKCIKDLSDIQITQILYDTNTFLAQIVKYEEISLFVGHKRGMATLLQLQKDKAK
jgi:hypothetical protein